MQVVGVVLGRPHDRVGQDQPALGVGVEHLDGAAAVHAQHVAGPVGGVAGHVLGHRHRRGDRDRQLQPGGQHRRGDHGRGAAHVGRHVVHVRRGLDRDAAGVERDALADQRDLRPRRGAAGPAQPHQPRLARRALPDAEHAAVTRPRRARRRRAPRPRGPAASASSAARAANDSGNRSLGGVLTRSRAVRTASRDRRGRARTVARRRRRRWPARADAPAAALRLPLRAVGRERVGAEQGALARRRRGRSARPSVLAACAVPAPARARRAPAARRRTWLAVPALRRPGLPSPTATSSGAVMRAARGQLDDLVGLAGGARHREQRGQLARRSAASSSVGAGASEARRRRRTRRAAGRAPRRRPRRWRATRRRRKSCGHVCAFRVLDECSAAAGPVRPLRDANDTGVRPAPAGPGARVTGGRGPGANAASARYGRRGRARARRHARHRGVRGVGAGRGARRGRGCCSRCCSPGSSRCATRPRRPTSPWRTRRAAAATSTGASGSARGRAAGRGGVPGRQVARRRPRRPGCSAPTCCRRSRCRPRSLVIVAATALNIAGVRWTARGGVRAGRGHPGGAARRGRRSGLFGPAGPSRRPPPRARTPVAVRGGPSACHRGRAGVLRLRRLRPDRHARRGGPRPAAHARPGRSRSRWAIALVIYLLVGDRAAGRPRARAARPSSRAAGGAGRRRGASAASGCWCGSGRRSRPASALLAVLVGISRTALAMAQRRDLPRRARPSVARGTPWRADLVGRGGAVVVAVLVGPVAAIAVSACSVLVYYARDQPRRAAAAVRRSGAGRWSPVLGAAAVRAARGAAAAGPGADHGGGAGRRLDGGTFLPPPAMTERRERPADQPAARPAHRPRRHARRVRRLVDADLLPGRHGRRAHGGARGRVGVFDVSHLGKLAITGPGAAAFVNRCFTADLGKIGPGQAQYTLCCTRRRRRARRHDRLPGRAGRRAGRAQRRQRGAGRRAAAGRGAGRRHGHRPAPGPGRAGRAGPAVGGRWSPRARRGRRRCDLDYMAFADVGRRSGSAAPATPASTATSCWCPCRRGAGAVWDALLAWPRRGAPGGLAARDTLRTEMGYPLHGQDLSVEITPVQAGSGWAVGWSKPAFWGRDALVAEKEAGPARRLRGLRATGRGVPRPGMAVLRDGERGRASPRRARSRRR